MMIEYVNGIVIGQIEKREYYRFYSLSDGRLLWDAGHFDNDNHAIREFWSKFSIDPHLVRQYKSEGVELRAWY